MLFAHSQTIVDGGGRFSMGEFDLWLKKENLKIQEAILLLMGINPSSVDLDSLDTKPPSPDYNTWESVLKDAIEADILVANKAYDPESMRPDYIYWNETTIPTKNLVRWLFRKEIKDNIFVKQNMTSQFDYLDPENKFYAPKLHAAVEAWLDVTNDPKPLKGTPKEAIRKYLEKNAKLYGLTVKRKPNKTAIEEICKIANWRPEGGAVKKINKKAPKKPKNR